MVLKGPFVWPSWNTAKSSQPQTYKQSLTFSDIVIDLPGTFDYFLFASPSTETRRN